MSTYLDRVRAERMEIRALKRRIKELEAIERAKSNLKRPFEYDRAIIRAIDMSRVKDSFKELVESICFNVTTKQYNRASPKQRLILLRTLAGQSKVKVDFKSTDETTYLQALVDAGILE